MAELVDARDLKSCTSRCMGSSPITRTIFEVRAEVCSTEPPRASVLYFSMEPEMDRKYLKSAAFLKVAEEVAERDGITVLQAYYKLKAKERLCGGG